MRALQKKTNKLTLDGKKEKKKKGSDGGERRLVERGAKRRSSQRCVEMQEDRRIPVCADSLPVAHVWRRTRGYKSEASHSPPPRLEQPSAVLTALRAKKKL
jgi:hypothetical protein